MVKSVVVGMGQIGQAVYKVTYSDYSYDKDDAAALVLLDYPVEVLHICFPYFDGFEDEVRDYIKHFDAMHTIVWSTVPIGTCRKIDEHVVHSPVEGRHPDLERSIKSMARFIGYNSGEEGRFFVNYFGSLGLFTESISSTEATELLKLRSTAKYGVNLLWAQYEAELCQKFGVAYSDLMEFDRHYNKLYEELDEPDFRRYVLYPPNGEIGGHCVVPNAKMLHEQYPSILLEKIIAMEKK